MLLFINSIFTSLTSFYVSSRILERRIKIKEIKFWIIVFINAFIMCFLYIITVHYFRVLLNFIFLIFFLKYYFQANIKETLITGFFVFILFVLAELLFLFFLILILNVNPTELSNKYFGSLIINLCICIFMVFFINIIKNKKYYFNIFDLKINNWILIFIVFLVLIKSIYFYYLYYYNNNFFIIFILIVLSIAIINILLINIIKEKVCYVKLNNEYEKLRENFEEYEKVLESYRLANHENKNNFIVLKGMIKEKSQNKEITNYINKIINEKNIEDEQLLTKTKRIPTGGLQGLIYQKMLVMKEKQIISNLEISRTIKMKQFKKIDMLLNENICTITGVLLDNAIEAVERTNEKIIGIYLYIEDGYLVITISNTFSGEIDFEKMDNLGYSNKKSGGGCGLPIVQKIIKSNSKITLQREIIRNIFRQKVKIKM